MKSAIMQPYFLPYLGYFQLIDAVDTYVNLDHVSFMKRSYMVRNTLKNGVNINLQVNGASQNKRCKDVTVNFENKWVEKTLKTITNLYGKEENFNEIMNTIIYPNFKEEEISVSDFNLRLIKSICSYLEIKTTFIDTSDNLTERKKGDGLIEICKHIGSSDYINAIGGTALYKKDYFAHHEINLGFCKMGDLDLPNQYASILDLLFTLKKEKIKEELNKYTII